MNKVLSLVKIVPFLFACVAIAGEPVGFAVEMNHADALYKIGETARLTLTATNGLGERVTFGTLNLTLDNYGPKKQGSRTIDLAKENPFEVALTLDEPGFARVQAAGCGRAKPFVWGVGFEPEKIVAGGEAPADFDAFWARSVRKLAETVPLDPKMTRVAEKSTAAFDYYRISFATFDNVRVHGFLTVPTSKAKDKWPVSVEVSSAGEGKWTIETKGLPDRIKMYFTVHGFEPPSDLKDVAPLHEALRKRLKEKYGVNHYAEAGLAVAPEEYYFYRVVLGINRAVDWLWARSDVDRTRFGYEGGSQGGGFGWMLCGLSDKFTSMVLRVPALSDQRGSLAGRSGTWPYAVENSQWNGQDRASVLRNIAYFDGASFAPRIKIPARIVVGLTDNTCPPSAVHATFNRLGSPDKVIYNAIGCGHGGQTRKHCEIARQWQYGL